jgi:hypothetical protein
MPKNDIIFLMIVWFEKFIYLDIRVIQGGRDKSGKKFIIQEK